MPGRVSLVLLGMGVAFWAAGALAWAFATSTKPIGLMYSFGLVSSSESLAGSLPNAVTLLLGRLLAILGTVCLVLATVLAWRARVSV